MEFIQLFFLYVALTALVSLLIGLFKPWITVWWEDTQNRKKVLKVYGTAAVVSFILYCFLFLF
jgi:hypothetical protein